MQFFPFVTESVERVLEARRANGPLNIALESPTRRSLERKFQALEKQGSSNNGRNSTSLSRVMDAVSSDPNEQY